MLEVRIATKGDANAIADFQIDMALETESLSLDRNIVEKGVEAVFEDPGKGCYYVAELNGEVVASMLTTYEWSDWRNAQIIWLQSVFVKKSNRKSGVFKAMYIYVKEMVSVSSDYCGIRLYVDKSNSSAQKVYEALGMTDQHYEMYEWMK